MSHDHGDHDHMHMTLGSMDGMNPSSTNMNMMMQMSFYWGKEVITLFSGWPDKKLDMYILALFFVFFLGLAVEVLSVPPQVLGTNSMLNVFIQAGVYALRMMLAYSVMLSVMSYNIGIFIVDVAGHTIGFFIVNARALAERNRPNSVSVANNNVKV